MQRKQTLHASDGNMTAYTALPDRIFFCGILAWRTIDGSIAVVDTAAATSATASHTAAERPAVDTVCQTSVTFCDRVRFSSCAQIKQ